MKLSDYIAQFLVGQGVKHVFGITGGAIVHTFDSIAKNKDITYICPQHEQAAAMMADAYSRITENLGVAIATSGPGASNLITGVACAHFDSIPTLFITGQVASFRLKKDSGVRQLGFQEIDTVRMFKPVTKYAVLVDNPKRIRYELEKAVYLAKSGRPGAVLVDIPDDIQRAEIEPSELDSFVISGLRDFMGWVIYFEILREKINEFEHLISESKRPIIILGAGVKLGKAQDKVKQFLRTLDFPVALSWATLDMFPREYHLNAGGFGVASPRYGNFAVQNADLIISLGARLDSHKAGSPLSSFAREAKKVIIDIDKSELTNLQTQGMHIDIAINSDVNDFLDIINSKSGKITTQDISEWRTRIKLWKEKYPSCLPEYYKQSEGVNSYVLMDALSKESSEGDIIISEAGGAVAQTMQGWNPKENQTLLTAFAYSPMGYALPASIGASFADKSRRVICICGDGGIQMNIHELATIVKHNLPIKIFVIDNNGYGMIRQTQDDWLDSRYEASCTEKGIAIPDFIKIARAYGLETAKIVSHREINQKIKSVLETEGAILCDVQVSEKQKTIPMLKYGRPIEDSNPLLDRKEFLENMIVKPMGGVKWG